MYLEIVVVPEVVDQKLVEVVRIVVHILDHVLDRIVQLVQKNEDHHLIRVDKLPKQLFKVNIFLFIYFLNLMFLDK
jgi:hypothetical protein